MTDLSNFPRDEDCHPDSPVSDMPRRRSPSRSESVWDELDQYLAQEGTPAERARIEQEFAQHEKLADVVAQLRRQVSVAPHEALDTEAQFEVLRAAITVPAEKTFHTPRKTLSPLSTRGATGTFAVKRLFFGPIFVAAGIAAFMWMQRDVTPVSGGQTKPSNIYATNPGQRASITLNDGTEVILNVATKLVIPDGFGIRHRRVQLDGEAQFTVVHSTELPFVVDANSTTVRDLATVFAVRSYHGNGTLTVAVNEGRVSVQPATLSSGTVVDARRVAIVTEHGVPVVRPIQDARRYFGWTRGQLVLSETSLADALVRLSQWYGMEFRAADRALLSLDVTATLPEIYDQEKMNYMAATLGARFERQGDTVTLVSSR